jgi:hypothetical protein
MSVIAEREGKDGSDPKNGLRKKDHKLFAKINEINEANIADGIYPRGMQRKR